MMNRNAILFLFLLGPALAIFSDDLDSVEDDYNEPDTPMVLRTPAASTKAIHSALDRLPKWVSSEFSAINAPNSTELVPGYSKLIGTADGVRIEAATPVDALQAVHAYLREFCGTMITWEGRNVPETGNCKRPTDFVREFRAPKVRYFGNPCTYSYSFAWWDWAHWERFIDWLAFSGFNMVLAPVGQEAIWRHLWNYFGVSLNELNVFFPGPAFLAWHRMGNINTLAGPMTREYHKSQLDLNKKIVKRLVQLGIVPVLPTFAGFVPKAFEKEFPELRFLHNACWNNFNETNSCTVSLHPEADFFKSMAKVFVQEQKRIYGDVTDVYSADPFNESPPKHLSDKDVSLMASSIYEGCALGNSKCVWLLQSWTFAYDSWEKSAVKSFLTQVPKGKLLILDLQAEKRPLFKEFESFYGHYFIWCLLQNFGGNTQMRGNLGKLHENYRSALDNEKGMAGMGLTMEGINQNYVVYQYMIDLAWTEEELDPRPWIAKYSAARYGTTSAQQVRAWELLLSTFYTQIDFKEDLYDFENEPESNEREERREIFLYFRPSFNKRIRYWFPEALLEKMAKSFTLLNSTLGDNELFRQDYADTMRELIQSQLSQRIQSAQNGYALQDKKLMKTACAQIDTLFMQLDRNEVRSLSEWIMMAREAARPKSEADAFERMARNQITLWGPSGQISDYARKEWSGLVRKYYGKRWSQWCDYIQSGARYSQAKFEKTLFEEIELPFGHL